ncbi:HBL322Cp [Eremothecium sinecaudum]|uniref:Protein DML1 n=1 Tax=Eremothecium sinecaudum TaxID=45286 RepID=A0A125RDU0_9SACH|nr:HBL322Cp [Eremothecium sinecaudum]AMD18580.1 HBL322Cp [Eremothecium sinecaudum]
MQEIVNLAASHRACHIITQFYNGQERLLNDRRRPEATFLYSSVDRIAHTVSYEPRALLFDAKNGSGALGRYQYTSSADYVGDGGVTTESVNTDPAEHVTVIRTGPAIRRSDYQRALDSGAELPRLDASNTEYWSDYARMIYTPGNVQELDNWCHDVERPCLPDFKGLRERRFDLYEAGIEVCAEKCNIDFIDGPLHTELEKCDMLQGFNVVTDVDSAWGGFGTQLVEILRDEMPKSVIFSWGVGEFRPVLRNRIRTTLSLTEESHVYFPLGGESLHNLSLWEQGAKLCQVFDTVAALTQKHSMAEVADQLTGAVWQRNLISRARSSKSSYTYFSDGIRARRAERAFNELHVGRGESVPLWEPWDTLPDAYKNLDYVDFAVTSAVRETFQSWRRDYLPRVLRHDDDRDDVADRLDTVAAEYHDGLVDDDDSDD